MLSGGCWRIQEEGLGRVMLWHDRDGERDGGGAGSRASAGEGDRDGPLM